MYDNIFAGTKSHGSYPFDAERWGQIFNETGPCPEQLTSLDNMTFRFVRRHYDVNGEAVFIAVYNHDGKLSYITCAVKDYFEACKRTGRPVEEDLR